MSKSISGWRVQTYYDFSPQTVTALRLRRDPEGSLFIPSQSAQIEFAKEPFAGNFTERSITGRKRSPIMGNRLIGSLNWAQIVTASDRNNFLERIYFPQDNGTERLFQQTVADSTGASLTQFNISQSSGEPVPSGTTDFYKGMIVGVGTNLAPNEFIGTFVRCTAYNGATKQVTVDSAVAVTDGVTAVVFWIPAGIPAGFYLNTVDEQQGEIACIMSGESLISTNVDNRIATQSYSIDFESRDLLYGSQYTDVLQNTWLF